jgi:hypothetical protein
MQEATSGRVNETFRERKNYARFRQNVADMNATRTTHIPSCEGFLRNATRSMGAAALHTVIVGGQKLLYFQ